jgi:hypothetical protein
MTTIGGAVLKSTTSAGSLVLVLSTFLTQGASGATILTNLAAPANGVQSISGGSEAAIGFTMGTISMNLADAQFTLFNGVNGPNGAPVAGSALNVGIFANGGGQPSGSALVTLTVPGTIGTGSGTYIATPSSSFLLAAGTTYWLLLNDPNSNDTLSWQATNTAPSAPGPPPPAATFAGAEAGPPFSPSGSFLVQIDANPVTSGAAPEPATLFLFAGGFLGLTIRRLRSGV